MKSFTSFFQTLQRSLVQPVQCLLRRGERRHGGMAWIPHHRVRLVYRTSNAAGSTMAKARLSAATVTRTERRRTASACTTWRTCRACSPRRARRKSRASGA